MGTHIRTQKDQALFETLLNGLIAIKALPENILLYMYYARGIGQQAESFSFTGPTALKGAYGFYHKNNVSREAILRIQSKQALAEGKIVSFNNTVISTYGGVGEGSVFKPLAIEELNAISLLIGGAILELTDPLVTGTINLEMINKYNVGLQLVCLGKDIESMRKTIGYGV